MIEFHLNTRSGVPTYLQLVHQVRHAARLGLLRPGDQLPTVREVVATLAINPNTVLKAYRELDREGLVEGRRGRGTFLTASPSVTASLDSEQLQVDLDAWLNQARTTGMDDDDIRALVETSLLRDTEGAVR